MERIRRALEGGHPLLYVQSWEETRVERLAQHLAKTFYGEPASYGVWSVVEGLTVDGKALPKTNDPVAALEAILGWNDQHGFQVFRLTSNLIPFASHPVNTLAWWEEFAGRFAELAALLRRTNARVSTHPGQYTVLSSAQPEVVEAALRELEYHDRLLAALGLDASHKIVLHVGSGASEPAVARARFAAGFARLGAGAQQRLVVENDERWPLAEVLELAGAIGLPVVGDSVYGVPDEQLKRQFLHAWRLAFPHPLSGERVEVESPLPPELQAALARFAS